MLNHWVTRLKTIILPENVLIKFFIMYIFVLNEENTKLLRFIHKKKSMKYHFSSKFWIRNWFCSAYFKYTMHQMSKFQTTRMHNVNIVMYIIHRENYALFSRKQTLTFCFNIKLTKILPYRHLSLNSHVIFKIKCIFKTQNANFRQVFIHFLWLQSKISKINKKT